MKKKYLYLGVIACLAVFAVGYVAFGYSGPAPKVVVEGDYMEAQDMPDTFGAVSGPDVYFEMMFHDGITVGGDVYATSTTIDGSKILAREIMNYVQIDMNYTGDGGADGLFTTTLPASTTLVSFLPNKGDCAMRTFRHLNTTTGSTTTITAGTGITLMELSAAAETVDPGEDVEMKWCREANGTKRGDFVVKIVEWTDI